MLSLRHANYNWLKTKVLGCRFLTFSDRIIHLTIRARKVTGSYSFPFLLDDYTLGLILLQWFLDSVHPLTETAVHVCSLDSVSTGSTTP